MTSKDVFEIDKKILDSLKGSPEYKDVVRAMNDKSAKVSKVDINLTQKMKKDITSFTKFIGLSTVDLALQYFSDENIIQRKSNSKSFIKTYNSINSYNSNLNQVRRLASCWAKGNVPLKNKKLDNKSEQYKLYKEVDDNIIIFYETIEETTDLLFSQSTFFNENNKINSGIKRNFHYCEYPYEAKFCLSIKSNIMEAIRTFSEVHNVSMKHIFFHSLTSLKVYERNNLLSMRDKYIYEESKEVLRTILKNIFDSAKHFNGSIKGYHEANLQKEFDRYYLLEMNKEILQLIKLYLNINTTLKGVIKNETTKQV